MIFALLGEKLDQGVLAEIKRRRPRHLRDDNFAWLNESVVSVKGGQVEHIPAVLGTRLSEYYDALVAFHGCRPISLESYQQKGLKPSDTEAIRNQARELFGNTPELDAAIRSLQGAYENHNRGVTWLCITKESFLQRHHEGFLLHGCEYLAALANRIDREEMLRNRGIPTIIECVIKASELPGDFWVSLSTQMIEDWFSEFLCLRENRPVCTLCLSIKTTILPEQIIRFHQFKEVRHPYSWLESGKRMTSEAIKFSYLPSKAPAAQTPVGTLNET
jgi:hypothetical protein